MRFDEEIYFCADPAGEYDPTTGDYDFGAPVEALAYADVTDASEQAMQLVYGTIKQGALVIRIQGQEPFSFNCIRIGEKLYKVDYTRRLERLTTYIVSEIQRRAQHED